MSSSALWVLAGVLPLLCPAESAKPGLPDQPPVCFKFSREDDFGRAVASEDRLVLEIWCPSGIGKAEIRPLRPWPNRVILRLHLAGLERLQLRAGGVVIEVSARSYPPFDREVFLRVVPPKGGNVCLQKQGDPFWMPIRALDATGEEVSGLPPKGGFWEIQLPTGLFHNACEPLLIEWIDFYR